LLWVWIGDGEKLEEKAVLAGLKTCQQGFPLCIRPSLLSSSVSLEDSPTAEAKAEAIPSAPVDATTSNRSYFAEGAGGFAKGSTLCRVVGQRPASPILIPPTAASPPAFPHPNRQSSHEKRPPNGWPLSVLNFLLKFKSLLPAVAKPAHTWQAQCLPWAARNTSGQSLAIPHAALRSGDGLRRTTEWPAGKRDAPS